jgi:hypothetical protein
VWGGELTALAIGSGGTFGGTTTSVNCS